MKINLATQWFPGRGTRAESIVEVLVGVVLVGVVSVSLYSGMAWGFSVTQLSRENLRATQIMLERTEGIRLYNWNQLTSGNMIPTAFTNYYYPLATNGQSKGTLYTGTMYITNAALNPPATYSNAMRAIVVTVTWTNGNVTRTRTVTTYQAQHGMQNYVFNN